MWKGRFDGETDARVRAYTESVSYDRRLARWDIEGSIAHAEALAAAGILSGDDLARIVAGLGTIAEEIEAGTFAWREELEDVHMNIEAALTERIGHAGARLHTARSRNDQVALDLRLYARAETAAIDQALRALQRSLVDVGERHRDVVLPGYTHLQRAQPVPLAHHLLAYAEMFERDRDRLADGLARIEVLPLGAGALAGSTIALDRDAIARRLGFRAVSRNSMDAVADRDFACEMLFTLALVGIHISRLGEDLVLWSSAEFGFVRLGDAFTTGSSLMPQKRNPDVAELARGRAGRLLGNLVALLTALKGLPMTYNRDLQEDKEALFDSIDIIRASLDVFPPMLESAGFDRARIAAAVSDPALLATDLAEHLVRAGVPFRQAHEVVGGLVRLAERRRVTLRELSAEDYRAAHPAFGPDARALLDLAAGLAARTAPGAPSPANVEAELARWRARLA